MKDNLEYYHVLIKRWCLWENLSWSSWKSYVADASSKACSLCSIRLSELSHAVTDKLQKLSPLYVIFEKYFKEYNLSYHEGWNDVYAIQEFENIFPLNDYVQDYQQFVRNPRPYVISNVPSVYPSFINERHKNYLFRFGWSNHEPVAQKSSHNWM